MDGEDWRVVDQERQLGATVPTPPNTHYANLESLQNRLAFL